MSKQITLQNQKNFIECTIKEFPNVIEKIYGKYLTKNSMEEMILDFLRVSHEFTVQRLNYTLEQVKHYKINDFQEKLKYLYEKYDEAGVMILSLMAGTDRDWAIENKNKKEFILYLVQEEEKKEQTEKARKSQIGGVSGYDLGKYFLLIHKSAIKLKFFEQAFGECLKDDTKLLGCTYKLMFDNNFLALNKIMSILDKNQQQKVLNRIGDIIYKPQITPENDAERIKLLSLKEKLILEDMRKEHEIFIKIKVL